jgi:hypothetical protein
MVQPPLDNPESENLFNQMAGDNGAGTIEERIETSPKKSDMQIVTERLNPDLGIKHLNVMEMSRIFPDVYDPMFWLHVKGAMKHDGLRLDQSIAYVNTSLSIAIDGEGRMDVIQVAGKGMMETDETKEKAKLGGLG